MLIFEVVTGIFSTPIRLNSVLEAKRDCVQAREKSRGHSLFGFCVNLIGRNKYLFLIGDIARFDVSSTKDTFSQINGNTRLAEIKD